MNPKFNPFTFLSLFKYWMNVLIVSSGIIQLLFFPSNSALFAVLIIILGWLLANNFIFTRNNFIKYTFSTFLLLGFTLTQFAIPIIFTLIEGKSITYNLLIPFDVFSHSILAMITLIFAHLIYKNWRMSSGKHFFSIIQYSLYKNYFFVAPSTIQLWLMGLMGIFAMVVNVVFSEGDSTINGGSNPIMKFVFGFKIFAYSPLFIPLASVLQKVNNTIINTNNFKIILYVFFLIIAGILLNSRGTFMQGITAIGLVFFLGLLIGEFDFKILKTKYILIGFTTFWFITGPLADISTAMVLVRGQRDKISNLELLNKTFMVFQDKDAINEYKKMSLSKVGGDWDEIYFDNIFLSRFCNLKYNDSNLVQGLKIKEEDTRMLEYSIDSFLSTLPTPILNLFNVSVDKTKVNSGSFGDFLFSFNGAKNAIGGFRTGHFAGTGMAAFGWWYLVILGIGMIPLFFLMDLFSFYFKINSRPKVVFSLAGIVMISTIFTFLGTSTPSQSVVSIYAYVVRGWIQSVVLYYVVFRITLFLSKTLFKS